METISYTYQSASKIDDQNLFLSKFNEVHKQSAPCFFWGKLERPFILSRCLICLSNTVQSSFNLSPFQLALLKDPIVTAGNERLRFEGFSHCAGVYARVDVMPEGHDGEFLENGTTNVDFNSPLIKALMRVKKNDRLVLSVGQKEVAFHKDGKSIVERKVPLPTKWIKGLTAVQHYFSESEEVVKMNQLQAIQLFRSIPKGKIKTDYNLIQRGNKFIFSPTTSQAMVKIGGIHRLRLLEPLLPYINGMKIFKQTEDQSVSFILEFGEVQFIFSLSRDFWRGFSGEGAGLEALIEDLPEDLVQAFDNYSYSNQSFSSEKIIGESNLNNITVNNLATRLSAMGLLGYDLDERNFFHRRLPFKLNRILSLNPRLKGAEKLITDNKVEIVKNDSGEIEAKVEGSGVMHYVSLKNNEQRCTCMWFSRNQGERGVCKHILAVKKLAKNE